MPEDPPGTPEANMGIRALDVWGSDADNVWAVGEWGKIAYRDSTGTWTYQDSQWYATPFTNVWGLSSNFVLAAGTKGTVRQFDGEAWQILAPQTPKKTASGEKWPSGQVVPAGPMLSYTGSYALDENNIWLFDATGKLIQYNDKY